MQLRSRGEGYITIRIADGVKGKSSEWALGTIREAYEKVVEEEVGRLGIVRAILSKTRIS